MSDSIVNFGAYSLCNNISFVDSGVRFITAENILDGYIDFGSARFIPMEQHRDLLWKSQVQKGQVLVAMAARLGYAAVYNLSEVLNSSQDIAKVTLSDVNETNPFYVAAYINSRVGRDQLEASQSGSVQQHTNLGKIKDLKVVIIPEWAQQAIADKYLQALSDQQKALNLYAQAEGLLLTGLGLDSLDLSPTLFYERDFSETQQAARLDAEYYSPRVLRIIATLSEGGLTISDVAKLAKRRFQSIAGLPFQYIEISDVGSSGDTDSKEVAGEEAPSRATWIVKPGDVLTTTVRPIRRLSAIVSENQEDFVCSSGFAVLQPRNIEPEVLLTYLRLPLVAELLDLHTTASMYPAISTTDLLRIPFKLPNDTACGEVVDKIRSSFKARDESRRLLDEAKQMVEEAVLSRSR